MKGRHPKPAHMRQNRTKKAGARIIALVRNGASSDVPALPAFREWHPLTVAYWARLWQSPMASQWLPTDVDALARLMALYDVFYESGGEAVHVLAEARLQASSFGLTPLDRSRLQWEIARGDEAEEKRQRRVETPRKTGTGDPRSVLAVVK